MAGGMHNPLDCCCCCSPTLLLPDAVCCCPLLQVATTMCSTYALDDNS